MAVIITFDETSRRVVQTAVESVMVRPRAPYIVRDDVPADATENYIVDYDLELVFSPRDPDNS